MTQPTVTVVIPTYNRRRLLSASLRSVLDQDFQDVEIIVSDNASTDDTAEYVASIGDPRLRYERTAENIGLFGNLSRALELGSGRYRVMLPDDDLMLPGNLSAKVAFLDAHPSAGMVHSAFRFLDDNACPYGETQNWSRLAQDTLESGESFLRRSIAIGGIVCVSSVMLRSTVVTGERFSADDGPYADLALWLRVASRSDVGFLTAPLSGYLVHQSSASSGFNIVRVKGERHQMTFAHADAILQAHGRFVQQADLDGDLRKDLSRTLTEADRRMRLTIMANATFPPATLAVLKKAARWRPGGLAHRILAVDAPVTADSR
jgi:glycosyltransferase involved in cell wall biosynthesis